MFLGSYKDLSFWFQRSVSLFPREKDGDWYIKPIIFSAQKPKHRLRKGTEKL